VAKMDEHGTKTTGIEIKSKASYFSFFYADFKKINLS